MRRFGIYIRRGNPRWEGRAPFLLAAAYSFLSACAAGPDYVRPTVDTPSAYKESQGWKVAQPADNVIRGAWWELFGDPSLNALEEQVDITNQNVIAAEAQFRQARALVQAARAGYFPTVTAGASATRARLMTAGRGGTASVFQLPLEAAWEPDIWGQVRRSVEASQASAEASAADLESVRLSARADLAQDYFLLRSLDMQKRILDETVAAYEESLRLTRNRYVAGVASMADVLQAETQLKNTRAQAIDIGVQRTQLENAIALLVGKSASVFSIPPGILPIVPPDVPLGVPSELLERRPDVAAAERQMAVANAQIGVAESAFFPTVTLSGAVGFVGTSLSNWVSWPNRFWSVGAAVSETVFEGGLRRARTVEARAAYEATVAMYRQTVLTGFQEVENNLAALRILEEEARVQEEAVVTARQSVEVVTNQYKGGIVGYLNVIVVQAAELSIRKTAVDIQGRRMIAAALLVKALGGGWDANRLSMALTGGERRHPGKSGKMTLAFQ